MQKFSKWLVGSILLLNVVFTAVVLYMFWQRGQEPSAIIVAWFGFTTGELWALSKIKRAKEGEKKCANTGS